MSTEWCKENYEKSVTSRAWAATPYDAGWEESVRYGEDLPDSAELRAIFEEEMARAPVPAWAVEIVERMIGPLPMCGHYAFPLCLTEICEAIGRQQTPERVHGCYTADRDRKVLMSYYVFCLDAWLKQAPLDVAQAELAQRADLGKDWPRILRCVYETLGGPTRPKTLLARRLIHRLRWWIKAHIWDDDRRDRFQLDVYSGDIRGTKADYGNPPYGDPYFAELALPEVKALNEQIHHAVPDAQKHLDRIESTWLCAPKVFRYLERIVAAIGCVGTDDVPDRDVSILQCEDTYPNAAACARGYEAFQASLSAWLAGDVQARPELGQSTPAAHWLVRILRHKLRLYEKHDPFGRLIGAKPGGKSGAGTI